MVLEKERSFYTCTKGERANYCTDCSENLDVFPTNHCVDSMQFCNVTSSEDASLLQMYQAMAEEEQKKAAQIQIASPLERKNSKISVDRGFASKA